MSKSGIFNLPALILKNYYITTPIYYVNGTPGLGQAYTSIAADVMARFKRLDGYKVHFLTGTDEHGQKVEKAAHDLGESPQSYVDRMSLVFRELSATLNIEPTEFIRTTEPRHINAAQNLWRKLQENGQLYLSKYAGWYAVRDEAFYDEKDIVNGVAPSGAPVEWVEEECYFFKLSTWQDKLLALYENNPDFIGPSSRRNEVISFVKGGLRDLCVSRTTFKWGVPVPGSDAHIMYVWIDALTNYITSLGYPNVDNPDFSAFWPESIHIMGKDIIRFHAVYWPAFLMAAGVAPPKRVFAHGWWTNEKQKMSKSLGNTIDPTTLVNTYGIDPVRYFLIREVPFGNDGDFSKTMLVQRMNTELSNDLGNLVQRVLSFVHKNADAMIPQPSKFSPEDQEILGHVYSKILDLRKFIDSQQLHKVCESIWSTIADANRYVDYQKPWDLRKTDVTRMNTVLYTLLETIRVVAIYVQPIMPTSAAKILDLLMVPKDMRDFSKIENKLPTEIKLQIKPEPIFPKWEEPHAHLD